MRQYCVCGDLAKYQCLTCYADNMDSYYCEDCKLEHIEAQDNINDAEIVRVPYE